MWRVQYREPWSRLEGVRCASRLEGVEWSNVRVRSETWRAREVAAAHRIEGRCERNE